MNMFFIRPFTPFYRFRSLLWTAVSSEIKKRYAGSVVGRGWVFASPLILVSIYAVVYYFIFRIRPEGMTPQLYILHVLSGVVPFISISEGLTVGTTSLEANRSLLRNTVFPIELIPAKAVLATLPSFAVGFLLLLFGVIFFGDINVTLVFLPLVILFQFMFVIGLVWMLSLVNLVFKDVKYIVNYLVMIATILSPIGYTLDMVPGKLRFLVLLNPFAHFVISFQSIVVHGKLPPAEILITLTAMSILVFSYFYMIFKKLKTAAAHYA